jgi:purine-nucleoside phosphorylase
MDALYRETSRLIEERKQQGCLVVEMESSAAYAAARFRNVPMIQFLYGADSLDSETWEQRNLLAYSAEECGGYAKLALECAVRL